MPAPPCPPPVKAAAILLIVVGANVVAAGFVLGGTMVVNVFLYGDASACLALLAVVGIPAVTGRKAIQSGVAILKARVRRVSRIGKVCVIVGVTSTAVSGFAAVIGVTLVLAFSRGSPIPGALVVVALALVPLLNAVAVLVAGVFLSNDAERYDHWRREMADRLPPPSNPESS